MELQGQLVAFKELMQKDGLERIHPHLRLLIPALRCENDVLVAFVLLQEIRNDQSGQGENKAILALLRHHVYILADKSATVERVLICGS